MPLTTSYSFGDIVQKDDQEALRKAISKIVG